MKRIVYILLSCFSISFSYGQNWPEHPIIEGVSLVNVVKHADIDNDGDEDIVAGSESALFWFENEDGMGNFSTHKYLNMEKAEQVLIVDLDGDGDKDIVTGIYFIENDGEGDFAEAVTLLDGSLNRIAYAVIDFDNDGDADILTAERGTSIWINDLYIRENIGNNELNAPVLFADITGEHNLEVIDIDDDNDDDIVLVSNQNTRLMLNDNGSFSVNPIATTVGSHLVVGDFSGNGNMDIIVFSEETGDIIPLAHQGGLNWVAEMVISNNFLKNDLIKQVDIGDLDNDGNLDIVYCGDADGIFWLKNSGDDLIFEVNELTTTTNFTLPTAQIFDQDNDGHPEILVSNSNTVGIYRDNDLQGFRYIGNLVFKPKSDVQLYSVDIDNDGDEDLVYNNQYFELISPGVFGKPKRWIPSISSLDKLVFEDCDNDGDLDFLTTLITNNKRVVWVKNDGFGNFSHDSIEVVGTLDYIIKSVAASDIDNDGFIEVVAATHQSGISNWEKLRKWERTANGGYSGTTLDTNVGIVNHIHIADIDGDMDEDILIHRNGVDALTLYENIGTDSSANFIEGIKVFESVADDITDFYLQDFDGDNDLDVMVSVNPLGFLHFSEWYRNDGDIWTDAQRITQFLQAGTNGATYIYPFDVDGDGDLDVIENETITSNVRWFGNDGTGQFTLQESIFNPTWFSMGDVFAMDVNQDGSKDPIFVYFNNPALEATTPYAVDENRNLSWFENTIFGMPNITGIESVVNCNNNDTPYILEDDYLVIELTVSGIFLDSNYLVTSSDINFSGIEGNYNETIIIELEEGSAEDLGNFELIIIDSQDDSLTTSIFVENPGVCSDILPVISSVSSVVCNDNGTPMDDADDYVEFDVTMTNTTLSNSYLLSTNIDGLNATMGDYGETTHFSLSTGSALEGVIIITIIDSEDDNVSLTETIENPGACSFTSTTDLNENEITLQVFPNPFKESMWFSVNTSEQFSNYQILIFDGFGNEVDFLNFDKKTLEWKNQLVSPGMYFYHLLDTKTGEILYSDKLLKIK